MKRCVFFILIMLFIPVSAYAIEIPQIEGYDEFGEWTRQAMAGDLSLSPIDVMNNVLGSVAGEIKGFIAIALAILVMSLLSSTVGTLNFSLGRGGHADGAFFIFFAVTASLVLSCFSLCIGYAREVIFNMCDFMGKLTPVIIVTLFAASKPSSAAVFEPVLSTAVVVVSHLVKHTLFPLITYSAVLSVAGNLGDKMRISRFVKMIKTLNKWILAFIITVFTGINSIYGFSAPAIDAVGAKAAKFAVGSLVPLVGNFLSDTFDTVTLSASVLKNAVGVSGIIVITLLTVTPVLKIGLMQLVLKLISALSEPIADKRITDMLWDVSESLTALFGVCVLVAVMFIINICLILRVTQ